MKKSLLLFFVVFFLISGIKAQITLCAGDFPHAGLSVDYMVADDSTNALNSLITIGNPGANGVYNVSGISTHINDTMVISYLQPSATPFPSFQGTADLAMFWKAFTIFGDTSVWQWSYFNSNATGLTLTGVGVIMDTSYFSHLVHGPLQYFTPQLSNPLQIMSSNFALGYTYHDSTKSHILLTSFPQLVIASKVIVDLEIDGWGTLTTPMGTYNVLRAKQTRTQAEAFIQPADTNTNYDYSDYTYTYQYIYYAKGIGTPIAEVNMDASFTNVYKVKYANVLPMTVNNKALNPEISVYPNPAADFITVQCPAAVQTEIINSYGQLIRVIDKSCQKVDVSGLAPGMYLIRAKTDGGIVTQKFTKI